MTDNLMTDNLMTDNLMTDNLMTDNASEVSRNILIGYGYIDIQQRLC